MFDPLLSGPIKRICFLGDSICFGQYVQPTERFVHMLGERLGQNFQVENRSVCGDTTDLARARLRQGVAFPYGAVVLQFGMNDCNYWKSVPGQPRVGPREFRQNLEWMIHFLQGHGVAKIILQTNHPTLRIHDFLPGSDRTYEDSNLEYNQLIRDTATSLGNEVCLCDCYHLVSQLLDDTKQDLKTLLLEDGLHLGPAGHQVFCQFYLTLFQRLFED